MAFLIDITTSREARPADMEAKPNNGHSSVWACSELVPTQMYGWRGCCIGLVDPSGVPEGSTTTTSSSSSSCVG